MAECETPGPPDPVWGLTCDPIVDTPDWVPAKTNPEIMVRNIGGVPYQPTLTPPPNGPCVPWVTCDEVRACCERSANISDDQLMAAIMYASEYLFFKTGKRYNGICERVVRPPCSPCCMKIPANSGLGRIGGLYSGGLSSSNYGSGFGLWSMGLGACLCKGACSCGGCDLTTKTIKLPGPIAGIKYVAVNGEILDKSAYKISGYRELIRVDGECWPQCNDITRDPTKAPLKPEVCCPQISEANKPPRVLPGKPDWVNDYLEGINWFYQPPPPIVDCKYCVNDHDPKDIPSWAKEFMSTLVCDVETNKLRHTPCEECSPWVNEYLRENNITILKGKCKTCCDANGNTKNGCGTTYVCEPCQPSTFKACCKERANRCCDPSYNGPSQWEANCCVKKGCSCKSHPVAPPTPTFTCLDSCPTAPPIQCTPDWAARYLIENNLEVPAPTTQNWGQPKQACTHPVNTPCGPQCLSPWVQAYVTENNLLSSIVYGKCSTCKDGSGSDSNPVTGAYYICDCIPGTNCWTEEQTTIVVRPCCKTKPNYCCDPTYSGEPIPGNVCCIGGCDCEPYVLVEEITVCEDCGPADSWSGAVPACADGSEAPCREWPNWLREYFGYEPIVTSTPAASDSLPDWVNDYLNDYHAPASEPKCGETVPVGIKACDSPWAKEFLRKTTDECGNPYSLPPDPEPVEPHTPYFFVEDNRKTECYIEAETRGLSGHLHGCGSEMDAWEIAYYQGREVPWGGKLAAAELACEIAKARCGDTNCRLPRNIAYLTRQDVSLSFTPMHKLVMAGLTGLFEVDMWIQSVNPCGIQQRATFHSPDMMHRRNRQLR